MDINFRTVRGNNRVSVVVNALGEIPTLSVGCEAERKIARCVLHLTLDRDEEDENLYQGLVGQSSSVRSCGKLLCAVMSLNACL